MNKSKSAFKTIAEVAEELGVATHVLRFWETKFSQIRPMKATGGRRYYRPDDVEILKLIKSLLYDNRYTIEGAQRYIKEKGLKNLLNDSEIQKDFFEDNTVAEEPQGEGVKATLSNDVLLQISEAVDTLRELRKKLSNL
ncbi:MAG: MerR family transcriptional regulator [Alphaproteobacteria bacterium]|nr:MerR family transcriptional regulator [Alphaproteobacteria bacterium]